MGAGLIQLKYLGPEASLFVGNPQISFFKSIFKSYSNYSKELIDLIFESPLKFDTSTYVNVSIHADLVQEMYLSLNLKVNVTDTFDLGINKNVFSSVKKGVMYDYNNQGTEDLYLYNYIYTLDTTTAANVVNFKVNEINTSLLSNLYDASAKKLDLSNVTNNILHYSYTYDGTDYTGIINVRFLQEDLTKLIKQITFEIDEYIIEKHNTDWFLIYNNLFNTNETSHKINNDLKFITPKMFNKNIQLYIPLRFFFTKQSNAALPIAALYNSDVNIKIKTNGLKDVFLSNQIISSVDFNKTVISANYIHLDREEKDYFLKNNHKLLIEQVQHQKDPIKNGIYNNIELYFTFLSKFIIWKLPYKYILDRAKILFNNNDLFNEQMGEYFHLVQPFECNLGNMESMTRMEDNKDTNGTYYLYSFCLYPQNKQPSGLCNMSRIDDIFLYYNVSHVNSGVTNNHEILMNIYCVNYNFLVIKGGKCKLEF